MTIRLLTAGSDELEPGVWAYSGDHQVAAEALIPNFWEQHADDLSSTTRGRSTTPDAGHWRGSIARSCAAIARTAKWCGSGLRTTIFSCTPSNPEAPLLHDPNAADNKRLFGFQAPFNHAYNPAAAVPAGLSGNGMPLSVQIVGRLGDDVGTLRLAGLMEALNPWAQRRPEALDSILQPL